MPKKVLFVHHSSRMSGGSWCLFEILNSLDRSRFEPYVLLGSDGPLRERICAIGIETIVDSRIPEFPVYPGSKIKGIFQVINGWAGLQFTAHIFEQYCKDVRPDVVYLNTSAQLWLPYAAKRAEVKCVILHNREHWYLPGVLQIISLIRDWMIKNYVDHIVSITECGARAIGFFEKGHVVRDWPFFNDESGCDIRGELKIEPNAFLILVPGGYQKIKGTLDLLSAVKLMKNIDSVAVVVLGCPKRQLSRWKILLKKVIKRESYIDSIQNLANTIDFVYLLPPTTQVKAYMKQSNVIAAPFTMPHASKAVLEGYFLEVPSIVYDGDESQEYVRHEQTGIIVSRGNVSGLAKALDELVLSPEKVLAMGKNGGIFVTDYFNRDHSMSQIMSLIDSSLSDSANCTKNRVI